MTTDLLQQVVKCVLEVLVQKSIIEVKMKKKSPFIDFNSLCTKNRYKAGYRATPVTCGGAGVGAILLVIGALGQRQRPKNPPLQKKVKHH